jgi:hypothetical protein
MYLSSPAEREVVGLRRFWRRAGPGVARGLLGPGADEATLKAVAASVLRAVVEQVLYRDFNLIFTLSCDLRRL